MGTKYVKVARVVAGLCALLLAYYAVEKLLAVTFFISGTDPLGEAKGRTLEVIYLGLASGALVSVFLPTTGLAVLIVSQAAAYMLAKWWGLDSSYYPSAVYDQLLTAGLCAFLFYDLAFAIARWTSRRNVPPE